MRKQVVWGEGDFTIRMNVPGSLGKPGRYGERVRLETSIALILTRDRDVNVEFGADTENAFRE